MERFAVAAECLERVALCGPLTTCSSTSPAKPTPACSFSIPDTLKSVGIGPEAAVLSVPVTAGAGCSWTASAPSAFLTIASGATGSGNGTVTVSVPENPGDARSGSLTIAGILATITQASAASSNCGFDVVPSFVQVPPEGCDATLTVNPTAGSGCPWTAGTSSPFLTIDGGTSGTGLGAVRVIASRNSSTASRTGQLMIAGRLVTVAQDAAGAVPCSLTVAPRIASVPPGGGDTTFTVSVENGAGCSWTAASPFANWLTVANPGPFVDAGVARIQVASNSGASRSGNVVVAGRQVTVQQPGQPAACAISVSPSSIDVPVGGSTSSFVVRMLSGSYQLCPWSYISDFSWTRAVATTSVNAPETTVTVTTDANPGFVRSGRIEIRWGSVLNNNNVVYEFSQVVDINQAGTPLPPCAFTMTPLVFNVGAAATTVTGTLTETSRRGCGIGFTQNALWILPNTQFTADPYVHIVNIAVAANPGPARTGTFQWNDLIVTVNQSAAGGSESAHGRSPRR